MKSKYILSVIFAVAVIFSSGIGYAVPYTFTCITNNSAANAAIGEAQLRVDATDAGITEEGVSQVLFTFYNNGPDASSITDVYFDDGHLLGIASITFSSGVDFVQYANPEDLPGGNEVGFETTEGFSADSESPAQPNGVNPGEWLGISFSLINGATFENVIADLDSGELLRIGIHVQGIGDNEGSEGFINDPNPPAPVPEPSTMLLIGSGLIGLASIRKRLGR